MAEIRVDKENKIEIPRDILEKLNIREGDLLKIETNDDGQIILDHDESIWELTSGILSKDKATKFREKVIKIRNEWD